MSIPPGGEAALHRRMVALLYHELRPEAASYSYVLATACFAEQLRLFQALPGTAFAPVVTFDDGHLSNYTEALPLLERHDTRAHFFITAGWTGSRAQYMEPRHLRALHEAGQTIGAHGWTHTLLTRCSAAQLWHELRDARSALEDHIGAPVTSMSLPGGRSNATVMQACREAGYTTVWTSVPGAVTSLDTPVVGRFNILAGHSEAVLRRLLDPASGALTRAARVATIKAMAQRAMGDRLYAQLWALRNRKEGDADDPAAAPEAHDTPARDAAL